MATIAQIDALLDALDTEESALIAAQDFDIATGTAGGRLSMRGVTAKREYIAKRRLQLRRERWRIAGAAPAEASRSGIDEDRAAENGDWI